MIKSIADILRIIKSGRGFRIKYGKRAQTAWLTKDDDWINEITPIIEFNDKVMFESGLKDGTKKDGSQKWVTGGKQMLVNSTDMENVIQEFSPEYSMNNQEAYTDRLTGTNMQAYTRRVNGFNGIPQMMPQENSETSYLREKVTDLKEDVRDLKAENKELKKENEKIKEDNRELRLELQTKDKEFELEQQKQEYKKENSFGGVIRALTDPAVSEGLAGYISAAKGGVEESGLGAKPQMGTNDLQNAIIEKVMELDELEGQIILNTLYSEEFQEAVEKQKQKINSGTNDTYEGN